MAVKPASSGPTRAGLALSLAVVLSCVGVIVYQACHLDVRTDAVARDGPAADPLNPNGIDGTVLVCGDGPVPDAVRRRFIDAAGGAKANVVLVPEGKDPAAQSAQREPWKPFGVARLTALRAGAKPDGLAQATGVWFDGPTPLTTALDDAVRGVLKRGGAVGGRLPPGLLLLPGVLLDTQPGADGREDRLHAALGGRPGDFGASVEPGTALEVRGRDLRALGSGKVLLCLAAGPGRPRRTQVLRPGDVADYTTLRRAARARLELPFPEATVPAPNVAAGSLLIVGGGGMPPEVCRKFIELAGGPDATIVVLPTAMPDPIPANMDGRFFRRYGAKNVHVLKARERKDVESPESLALLRQATGVWFDGGRQWRFIDAYEGTKAHDAFHDVLRRGGVIGGSSAGASIQGYYMCRGDPRGPGPIMCEGYERGLGFLPGVAIDQHFTQRNRLPDMTRLMNTYPQLLGLGLDEATAVVVKGHVAEVMGRGKAHFYDRRKPVEPGKPDYEAIAAGARYDLAARKTLPTSTTPAGDLDTFLAGLLARSIGPANMGGRIVDIEAVETDPKTVYVAAATGGVWKTANGGDSWTPVFENQATSCIGDIAVAPSNPNVVWVGTGEGNPRNSVTWGHGVYRSADAGRTWQHTGLAGTRHIGRVVVHPKNPDVAYVAALGDLWVPTKERGLYRTTDGGKTWALAKYIDENTGFVDVAIDPEQPETLYAAAWQVRRDAFSGGNPAVQTGPGSGLYKTTDGGRTWVKMGGGLPDRPLGRCGLSVYRKDPKVVYAVVQTDRTSTSVRGAEPKDDPDPATGGVFRSDDRGVTWKKLNSLCPRPFYYGQIRVDPTDDRRVYVLGISFHVSTDGGRTFPNAQAGRGTHPDHHALWINPANAGQMWLGNDGGLYRTADRGKTWEAVRGMAIGQFYAVAVDTRSPYRVYGGLQDNGSWGGPSATRSAAGITPADWRRVASADGFYCAADPTDPDTVYAEGQYGMLQRISLAGGRTTTKRIKPAAPPGEPAYRFNWSSPLLLSPHDPKTLYYGGNVLFKSINRGDTWTVISPDLTRYRSGPSASTGHTLTTVAESPLKAGVLWAGTDDGRVHVTRDGGQTWTDVGTNLPGVVAARWVTRVECSPFDEATAFVTVDRHRHGDLRPYVFRTTDFGKTWKPLAANLPADEPVHVVRQSSRNRDLLFVGTEKGLYVSLDGGAEWRRHTRGLPTVPVHDLVIHPRDRELVIGTHGRSVYVMDVAPLEALTPAARASVHLFDVKPAAAYEPTPAEAAPRSFRASNPPVGAVVGYFLPAAPSGSATLTVTDFAGKVVTTLPGAREAGFHQALWNLRRAGQGTPLVPPGEYVVTLRVDGRELAQRVVVTGP